MITNIMNAGSDQPVPLGETVMTLDIFSSADQTWSQVLDPGTVVVPWDVELYWHDYIYRVL